jgi:hypothetical protein
MNCENFIRFSNAFKAFKWASENRPDWVTSTSENTNFYENIENGLKSCKIFNIEDSIKKLLCLTNPPNINDGVDEIRLPFNVIFIDVEFTQEELVNLGIDIDAKNIVGIVVREGTLIDEKTKEVKGKDLNITISSLQSNDTYWFDTYNKNMKLDVKEGNVKWSVKENETSDKRARDFIHKFVINFLNFINEREVEIFEHKRSEQNMTRRAKKGMVVLPSSLTVNIYGKLKKYVDSLVGGEKFHYNYSFWIRGHWRTYRAPRFKNKKRAWVLPHVRGKGVLIEKTYKLKENHIHAS